MSKDTRFIYPRLIHVCPECNSTRIIYQPWVSVWLDDNSDECIVEMEHECLDCGWNKYVSVEDDQSQGGPEDERN